MFFIGLSVVGVLGAFLLFNSKAKSSITDLYEKLKNKLF